MSRSTVHVGRDGWLFYRGLTGEVVGLYERSFRLWRVLRRWRRMLEERARRFEGMGARYLSVVVPEKLTILPDYCTGRFVDARLSPAIRLSRLMRRSRYRDTFLDLVPIFRAHEPRTELFPRTDSHWSYQGCHLAYREICRALGFAPRTDLLDRPYTERHVGDLGSWFEDPPPDTIRIYRTERLSERTHVNPLIQAYLDGRIPNFPGIGCRAEFRNASPDAHPQRVLLFGTSSSNFDPMFLTGMLAETFREVHFAWSPLMDWDVVAEVKPDIVLYEIIERALGWIADDSFDLTATAKRLLDEALAKAPEHELPDHDLPAVAEMAGEPAR